MATDIYALGELEAVCSFCGKALKQVARLIAGLGGVNICNECVELCNEVLLQETLYVPQALLLPPNTEGKVLRLLVNRLRKQVRLAQALATEGRHTLTLIEEFLPAMENTRRIARSALRQRRRPRYVRRDSDLLRS